MDITKDKLIELGFKRYYRDGVWRMLIGKNVLGDKMYLTLVDFETAYTWYINSFEQFTGLTTMKRLQAVLCALGKNI
jgi:hypothetical protein